MPLHAATAPTRTPALAAASPGSWRHAALELPRKVLCREARRRDGCFLRGETAANIRSGMEPGSSADSSGEA